MSRMHGNPAQPAPDTLTPTHPDPVLDAAGIRAIAVEVEADPRTVRKILSGGRVRGLTGRRVLRALTDLGYFVSGSGSDKEGAK